MTTFDPTPTSELAGILTALIDGQPSEEQLAQLESLLAEDPEALAYYRKYTRLCALLEFERSKVEETEEARVSDIPAETESVCFDGIVAPPTILCPPFVANAYHGVIGYFSQEIPFALLLATFMTGLGLWLSSFVYVSHHKQLAKNTRSPSSATRIIPTSQAEYVGRITGMVDVTWSDATTAAVTELVALDRRYALASGLMEITYDTGAKVILQGPCTYRADSRVGGYLSVGKLTAKLEKRGEKVISGQWPVASEENPKSQISKSQISNPSSPAPRPQSPAPMFAVRTPTAVVTDLGTEFGVEVNEAGATESHVFQGKIRVQVAAVEGESEARAVFLGENESVRVERPGVGSGDGPIALHRGVASAQRFVRVLPLPKKKPSLLVLEHFRLGEDDRDSVAGQPADDRTVNDRHTQFLEKHGSPLYAAGLAVRGSLLAMSFTGAANECFFKPDLSMSPTNNFILEAWVRPNRVPNELVQLVCNGQSGRNGYGLVAKCGKWGFLLCNLTSGGFGVACEPDKWTHLALVCERKKVQFWVNGRPDGPSRNLAVSFPDGPFAVGGYPDGPLSSFDGQIDDVRLSEFRAPFSPEMLLFIAGANPPSSAADLSQASHAKAEPAQIHTHVTLSNPNNVAPLATPTTSSSVGAERGLCFLQIGNAFDGKVHSSTWETPGGADADGTSFIFGDSDDSPTLDLSWEQPQHIKSLQTYVCAGGANNGVTDFDRTVATVKFFVDRGAGWELAGTVSTANTNDIGAFDLVKLDGDWSNVKQVRYQLPKAAGGCSGPRVAEVLAIADQDADRSATQRVVVPRNKVVP